jgi:hypothetical protein
LLFAAQGFFKDSAWIGTTFGELWNFDAGRGGVGLLLTSTVGFAWADNDSVIDLAGGLGVLSFDSSTDVLHSKPESTLPGGETPEALFTAYDGEQVEVLTSSGALWTFTFSTSSWREVYRFGPKLPLRRGGLGGAPTQLVAVRSSTYAVVVDEVSGEVAVDRVPGLVGELISVAPNLTFGSLAGSSAGEVVGLGAGVSSIADSGTRSQVVGFVPFSPNFFAVGFEDGSVREYVEGHGYCPPIQILSGKMAYLVPASSSNFGVAVGDGAGGTGIELAAFPLSAN